MSLPAFVNEPILELRRRDAARALLEPGWRALEPRLPLRVADADRRATRAEGDALVSTDPGAPDRVVALAPTATPDDAAARRRGRRAARGRWAATPAVERARR